MESNSIDPIDPRAQRELARIARLSKWRTWLVFGGCLASTALIFTFSSPALYVVIVSAVAVLVPAVILDREIVKRGGPDMFGRRRESDSKRIEEPDPGQDRNDDDGPHSAR
jgi:hypothetical protein